MSGKVVLINNLYKPYSRGGAEMVVEKQAQEFLKGNKEVIIITWSPWRGFGSWRPQKGVDNGILIYRFWVPNIFSYKNLSKHNFIAKLLWHFFDIFNLWSGSIVKNILTEEKPNEVWTHNLMGLGFFLSRVIQGLEIKHMHYLHDVQLVELSGILPWYHDQDSFWQKMYSAIMRRRLGKPDMVVSPTNFLLNFYQERGFFLNTECVIEKSKAKNLYFEKKKSGMQTQFLYVGLLEEHKGIRVLMQAWDQMRHSRENGKFLAELCIVGDGALQKEVGEWAKRHPNVQICGRLEGEELQKVYEQSEVLIFPSVCLENNPTVIHEALKYGLKVIAANTGGVEEIVKEEDLFESENVEGLGMKIEEYLTQKH